MYWEEKECSTYGQTHRQTQGEPLSCRVMALGVVHHDFDGGFFWVSFGQSFCFVWFRCIKLVCLRTLPCVLHASLSQDGFYRKGIWVEHPLTLLSFGLQGAFLRMCGRQGLLTWRMRTIWSGQGPATSLNCPAILVF